jgi:hypothetical protein
MFKIDGMQNKKEDKMFEMWTKTLEKQLPSFWNEFLGFEENSDDDSSFGYSRLFSHMKIRRSRSG